MTLSFLFFVISLLIFSALYQFLIKDFKLITLYCLECQGIGSCICHLEMSGKNCYEWQSNLTCMDMKSQDVDKFEISQKIGNLSPV